MGGKWLRDDLRIALYLLDDGTCTWCGARGWGVPTHQVRELSLDHYVPVIRRGTNRPANLITACCTCNSSRGAVWAPRYLERLVLEGRLASQADADEARRRIARARRRRTACDGLVLQQARLEARRLLEAPPAWLRFQRLISSRAYRDDVLTGERDRWRAYEAAAALEGRTAHADPLPLEGDLVDGPTWCDDNPELDAWRAWKAQALEGEACPDELIPF